jgi:anti-anti-sigma factor
MSASAATVQTVEDSTIQVRRREIAGVPGGLLLTLKGELNTYNTPYLQKQVTEAIRSGFIRIVFDCERVPYMASLPIGYLVSLVKELGTRGGGLVLVKVAERVLEILQVLGLASWLAQAQTTEEAFALLSPPGEGSGPFPKIFDCPICRKKLRVVKQGRYRCRECKTVLVVESSGRFSIR